MCREIGWSVPGKKIRITNKSLGGIYENLRSRVWVASFLTPFAAFATWVVPETVESLSKKAPIVVYGFVAQIEVNSQNGTRTALVESLENAKTPEQYKFQKEFLVELTNKSIPRTDLVELVAGAPELRVGEEIVLYLSPANENLTQFRKRTDSKPIFVIEGFHQGKLKVYRDKLGVRYVGNGARSQVADALSPAELKNQKTTKRTKTFQALIDSPSENSRSLDSVLNLARENSRGESQ